MTDAPAHDDTAGGASSPDGDESGTVQGTDPDIVVPGESDTAGSGGQGAPEDRYADGKLGGGAVGGAVAAPGGLDGGSPVREDSPPTDEHGEPIDDGMGADSDPDAAGEDEPIPGIDD